MSEMEILAEEMEGERTGHTSLQMLQFLVS